MKEVTLHISLDFAIANWVMAEAAFKGLEPSDVIQQALVMRMNFTPPHKSKEAECADEEAADDENEEDVVDLSGDAPSHLLPPEEQLVQLWVGSHFTSSDPKQVRRTLEEALNRRAPLPVDAFSDYVMNDEFGR